MKKLISMVIAFTLVIGLLPAFSFSANALTEDIYTYTVTNGESYGQSNLSPETICDLNNDSTISMEDIFVLISNLGRRSIIE